MFYERKIRYLDYFEKEERIRGSGFAKLEVREASFRLEITVKDSSNLTGTFSVFLLEKEKEAILGEIGIQKGCGIFRYVCCISDGIGETGIPYEKLSGICILLGEGREISGRWNCLPLKATDSRKESVLITKESGKEIPEPEPVKGMPKQDETSQDKKIRETACVEQEEQSAEEKIGIKKNQLEAASKNTEKKEKISEEREHEKRMRLQEDKWTQLCTIYPHIWPFRDEREYLSISPSDFVLLPSADYLAAHNSFLLHGYYNYHHLILGRLERRGEILYYLGVPGNYFEKEKQVAVMFGFESFECAEEPAEYGDFGYYMMRTNI